jgi:rare lipoprotein A
MKIFVAYNLKISFTMRTKLAILLCFLYMIVRAEVATETGLASVYSAKFQGKITASGEQFNHQAISASHRRLPFGTLVRVTRLDTKKSIVVRINDRGPFVNEYVTNLSLAAAQRLGMAAGDETRVEVEVLKNDVPVSVMPDTRENRTPPIRRQNQSPAPSVPKSEPQPEVTPKSIHPREYRVVPNSNGSTPRSGSSEGGQKKNLI